MAISGKPKVAAIIPSAGMGKRMGSRKKAFLTLGGRPMLALTLKAFESCVAVSEIIVVAPQEDIKRCEKEVIRKYRFRKVSAIVGGGKERQDSVYNGICAIKGKVDAIVVHDAARPFVTCKMISECVAEALRFGAAVCAVAQKDTLKEVRGGIITRTVPREHLYSVQTPQAFQYNLLKKAHESARDDKFLGTDEAMLVERLGADVKIVEGSSRNFKITTVEDLELAKKLLR